eukprot:10349548-Ditylum_brightwellii.AAC.1
MQPQMKQREDSKATREQQLLIVCMEHKSSKMAREEQEDFMITVMMMVTGAKPTVPVPTSTLLSNGLVTPTKSPVQSVSSPEGTASTAVSGTSVEDKEDDDEIEQKIAEEM